MTKVYKVPQGQRGNQARGNCKRATTKVFANKKAEQRIRRRGGGATAAAETENSCAIRVTIARYSTDGHPSEPLTRRYLK